MVQTWGSRCTLGAKNVTDAGFILDRKAHRSQPCLVQVHVRQNTSRVPYPHTTSRGCRQQVAVSRTHTPNALTVQGEAVQSGLPTTSRVP